MEYIDVFSWAVSEAFCEPLNKCRFELGDTLYDSRLAYEGAWEDALPHLTYGVQVLNPPRGPATKATQGEESVFESNWFQPVELALKRFREKTSESIKSTQGALYSLLWKGQLDILSAQEVNLPCFHETATK